MAALPEQALLVSEAIPRSALHPAVLVWTEANSDDRTPWCLALSGGADSVALLLLIWAHWPERRGDLVALHFNHCLRGAESDGDEDFCRGLCQKVSVSFRSARWSGAPDQAAENDARDARHAYFAEAMSGLGARALWTGHQKNDIAETQLMRLARGSGTAGLSAPRPVRSTTDGRAFLRPLLTVTRTQLQGALSAAGVPWREDATNGSSLYFRNRIRSSVTPLWEQAAPNDPIEGAALSRERLEEDDQALESWLDELSVFLVDGALNFALLANKPRALWRRALHRWAPALQLERRGFEELLALCERGEGRFSVGTGFAIMKDRVLRFEAGETPKIAWTSATLHLGATLILPDGAALSMRLVELTPSLRTRILAGLVKPSVEAFLTNFDTPFTVRAWKPGDRFRPLGSPGSVKLQDLFVNRKIPVERRGSLPVICSLGGGIVWVPGLPPADNSKLTDHSVTGLQLTYQSGTSTLPD